MRIIKTAIIYNTNNAIKRNKRRYNNINNKKNKTTTTKRIKTPITMARMQTTKA